MIVNNYRDYEQDKAARKRTTIVLFGRTFGLVTYLLNGILAFLITLPLLMDASPWLVCLFAAFSVLFAATWLEMKQYQGRELNRTLGHTARNVFIYAVLLSVVLLFGSKDVPCFEQSLGLMEIFLYVFGQDNQCNRYDNQ